MNPSQFYSVLTFLVISSHCVNSVPFPDGGGTKSSDLTDGGMRFPETSIIDTKINQSEENVNDNLIQSGESDTKYKNSKEDVIPEKEDITYPTNSKRYFDKDSTRNEGSGQEQLSKFYRITISPRSSNSNRAPSSDSIIFPSTEVAEESSNIESYRQFPVSSFSDKYNRHRPNIPTPQVSIPFNFGFGLPALPPQVPAYNTYNRRSEGQRQGQQRQWSSGSGNYNDFLTREQDDILYHSLVELFRGLFTRQQQYRTDQEPQPSYNRINFARSPAPTTAEPSISTTIEKGEEGVEGHDEVKYQSLYSGPKLEKSPCPNGMHRRHDGSCHEKASRRLLNSSG